KKTSLDGPPPSPPSDKPKTSEESGPFPGGDDAFPTSTGGKPPKPSGPGADKGMVGKDSASPGPLASISGSEPPMGPSLSAGSPPGGPLGGPPGGLPKELAGGLSQGPGSPTASSAGLLSPKGPSGAPLSPASSTLPQGQDRPRFRSAFGATPASGAPD